MKKVIIIGASSGIGAIVAADFARLGMQVGVAARRLEPLQEIASQYPGKVIPMCIDVTAVDAVARFRQLIEQNGGMDILVYAAGVGFRDPELNQGSLTNTIEVNVTGFARIVAEAYKYFRDNADVTRGQIAAITSVAATKGIGVSAAYSASKRFEQTFLEALAQLAVKQQVNVDITDIRPGFVRTALLAEGRKYPMLMEPEYAAKLIEIAILKHKRVAYIDYRWHALVAAWRLIPSAIWRKLNIDF